MRALGAALVAVAAWFGWREAQAAQAAPVAVDPVTAAPSSPSGFLGIVMQVNADEFGRWFDPALVMAVMQIESAFKPLAYRAEPHINDASYGLMQVLYSTAVDRGFGGPAEGLYDPETNIRIGMRHLKWSHDYLAQRMPGFTELHWISSYNGGVGAVSRGWTNAGYYARFQTARRSWAARV